MLSLYSAFLKKKQLKKLCHESIQPNRLSFCNCDFEKGRARNEANAVNVIVSPTCLHRSADLSTAGCTHRVRQVTQYADTSCHGRDCKVGTNIVCQRGGGGGSKKKEKYLTASWLVLTCDSRAKQHKRDEVCEQRGNPRRRGAGAWARCKVSAQHHQLVCLCDRCTSVSRWEWPRSSRGAELQSVVTSVTPRHSERTDCAVTLSPCGGTELENVLITVDQWGCWTALLICVASYQYRISHW